MNLFRSGISALTKLLMVAGFAMFFLVGMAGVVYMSLQGNEVAVPDIVGKGYSDSEKELSALGLKIKRRADRPSSDAPNTILEQLPKPGETVKTGQMILVVTSTPGPEDEAPPGNLKKGTDEDDSDKIEEMISERPKKPKANTASNKKKADTTRDVIAKDSNSNSNTNSSTTEPGNSSTDKVNRNSSTPAVKPANTPADKSQPAKPTGGEARPRTVLRPGAKVQR